MIILRLLPTALAVIAIVLMILVFQRKFNNRANKLLLAKFCLLVSASYPVTQLLGVKHSIFILVFCTVVWLINALVWYLNARFLSKK